MPTAISIRSLTKAFGVGPAVAIAVNDISLDINPGELFFLLGPSGCGKTTLLRMIAGFIDPTSGSIAFDGRDVTQTPPNKRNTGMVFQSYALWPHMTVAQNVAFGLGIRKVPRNDRERRVADALAAVRMAEYAERKPNQLSGGQQQRVALARALVIRPDVLLLDEPLSNLDARLRIELRSEIRRVCKETGITAVYVTHDQKEALSMADRVSVLSQGQVVQTGTPEDLYRRPRSRFVAEFLGETNFIPASPSPNGGGAPSPKGEVPRSSAAEGAPSSTSSTLPLSPPRLLQVSTPAGPLLASAPSDLKSQISNLKSPALLLSIRPEAFRLSSSSGTGVPPVSAPPNSLRGRILDTTYLGEIAQYTIELPGNTRVRVADLNPLGARSRAGEEISLSVAPEDIVVLPHD